MYQLDILVQHCDALLLAEVAGWVHNWDKCIDMKLASDWKKGSRVDQNKIHQWQQRGSSLSPGNFASCLQNLNLNLCASQGDLKTIAEIGREPSKAKQSGNLLAKALGKSHDAAHVEKELGDQENVSLATDWLSSPFGWENVQPDNLLMRLLDEPTQTLQGFTPQSRNDLLIALREVFSEAWGDTRRPINEVTLWDWSSIVAALYRAELARCVLTSNSRQYNDIAWRLLSVRVNGLDYLLGVSGIPDLLARRALLKDAWDKVQTLLEETYPMGLEVYRDENGPVFVVPDIDDLLQNAQDNGKTLREFVLEAFAQGTVQGQTDLALAKEIVPDPFADPKPWKVQPAPQELPPIAKHLEHQPATTADPNWLRDVWQKRHDDICTVCGLRPQGPDLKAKERNLCDVCEQRRADRARDWRTQWLSATIWLDEVADDKGRFALIVGSFDLTHWLSGACVRSLLVREPNQQNGYHADTIAKNPSFARLRRIWETTRAFWQEVGPTDNMQRLQDSVIGKHAGTAQPRLEITGQVKPAAPGSHLELYHAYELVLSDGVSLSALWDGQQFITCDNLPYLSRRMRSDIQTVLKPGSKMRIEVPGGYGATRTRWGTITIASTSVSGDTFVRAIPLLAEPRVFLALVPADRALDVVGAIRTKYEREMGKVRNRLPLHLGVVFAPWRTPLRAVLDAGRQMLRLRANAQGWEVVCCARKTVNQGDPLPPRFAPDQQGQFAEWFEVTLQHAAHQVTWHVPALMGDGQTEDLWYPYAFLDVAAEPVDRTRRFTAHNPWTGQDGWLIHAAELQPGDRVFFTPSTFDFEFLDTTARRFDVHYDDQGRRTRRTRPFYLDDFERMEALWGMMKRLSRTQRYQVVRTIEEMRELWFGADHEWRSPSDPTFRQFAADTLAGAEWPKDQPWKTIPDQQRERLIEAAARGELADWFELHEQILKEEK